MSILRTSALIYAALGCLFVAWQSRQWWDEIERRWRQHRGEHGDALPTWFLTFAVGVSLVADLVLWPECAWRLWRIKKGTSGT